jgi:hypothetical protein
MQNTTVPPEFENVLRAEAQKALHNGDPKIIEGMALYMRDGRLMVRSYQRTGPAVSTMLKIIKRDQALYGCVLSRHRELWKSHKSLKMVILKLDRETE